MLRCIFKAANPHAVLLIAILLNGGCTEVKNETDTPKGCTEFNSNGCPGWFTSMPVSTWKAIGSNTFSDVGINTPDCSTSNATITCVIGSHNQTMSLWSGAIAREDFLDIIAQGGGSNGSSDNGVYEFGPFSDDNPHWERSHDPSRLNADEWSGFNGAYYPDGLPVARHGYEHQTFINELVVDGKDYGNRWFAPWATYAFTDRPSAGSFAQAASFKFDNKLTSASSGSYEKENTFKDFPGSNPAVSNGAGFAIWDDQAKVVWAMAPNTPRVLYAMDPVKNSWEGPYSEDLAYNIYTSSALDPERRIIAVFEGTRAKLYFVDVTDDREILQGRKLGATVEVTMTGDLADETRADKVSLAYEPVGGTFVGWSKISATSEVNLYTLKPTANIRDDNGHLISVEWHWEPVNVQPGGDSPTLREKNGTFGRFQYIRSIHALALVNDADQAVFVFKIPPEGL